jgi:hypothetical protein
MISNSKDIFAVPSTITKVETMADRTLKLRVDTTQELVAEEEAKIMRLRGTQGWFVYSDREIKAEEIPDVDIDTEVDEKSPSQRLRNVIWVHWDKNTNKQKTFDVYYREVMDKIINRLKEDLE